MNFNKCSRLIIILSVAALGRAQQFSNMSRPKVLVSNPTTPAIGINLLRERGCDVAVAPDSSKETILKLVKGVNAIFWCSHFKLDVDILDAAGFFTAVFLHIIGAAIGAVFEDLHKSSYKFAMNTLQDVGEIRLDRQIKQICTNNVVGAQMKTIGTMSAGYNHIDIAELKKRGIRLGNTPQVLNDAVADIGVMLTLAASRRVREGRLAIEKKAWETDNSQWLLGQDIAHSTVGILGLGGIGQTVVKRLKGFDVKEFIYTGHQEKPEGKELGARFVSLDTLTKESDFIIVCVPLSKETEAMCNDDFFAKMKKTAIFVNISRGAVVDQEALIRALKNGTIFAAGLDVTTPEPLPPNNELMSLPNAVILPHLGSATIRTRNAMSELTAQNILRGLGGEEMFAPVV